MPSDKSLPTRTASDTLTELLSSIYVVEHAHLSGEAGWQDAWERMGDRQRALTMGSMVEVVRQLGLIGVNVTLEIGEAGQLQVSIRTINGSPKRFGVVQGLESGGTLVAMAASHPDSTPSRMQAKLQAAAVHTDPRVYGYTGNLCGKCGSSQMVRAGACEKCENCGDSSGCS